MKNNKKTVLSGIQPSGELCIANYIGAMKNWIKIQEVYNSIFLIVDLHSITVSQVPSELRKRCYSYLCQYLAVGIDPEKSIIAIQSHIPEHLELMWILNTITPLGDLSRMTQFKDKTKNQTITVKVISTDNKGLYVRPEGCEMDFQIKKSAIAINAADARPNRWTGGEKLDCAIAEMDLKKRKITLSIKLLEEIEKAEALEKFGTTEGSGKSLPFSSLADDLKKKKDNKK